MQWTVERINAELCQLDCQLQSYIERCALQPGSPRVKMDAIIEWIKSTMHMLNICLADISEQYPRVYEEVLNEQLARRTRHETNWHGDGPHGGFHNN